MSNRSLERNRFFTRAQVIAMVQREVKRARSVNALAREWDIRRIQSIYEVLECRRSPGHAILRRLGLERVLVYRKTRVKST